MISNLKSFIALLILASSLTSSVNAAPALPSPVQLARQEPPIASPISLNILPTSDLVIVTITETITVTPAPTQEATTTLTCGTGKNDVDCNS